mmetsp:Transcript_135522/g.239610  ORF Transcript_135522/g.239610 Transcript_135522/m.239610 type:complete len:128 (+) Transcript_135522:24-407(+)
MSLRPRRLSNCLDDDEREDVPICKEQQPQSKQATLLKCFAEFDADGNGMIEKEELTRVLQKIDPVAFSDIMISLVWDVMDRNGDEQISYEEFLEFIYNGKTGPVLERAFNAIVDQSKLSKAQKAPSL